MCLRVYSPHTREVRAMSLAWGFCTTLNVLGEAHGWVATISTARGTRTTVFGAPQVFPYRSLVFENNFWLVGKLLGDRCWRYIRICDVTFRQVGENASAIYTAVRTPFHLSEERRYCCGRLLKSVLYIFIYLFLEFMTHNLFVFVAVVLCCVSVFGGDINEEGRRFLWVRRGRGRGATGVGVVQAREAGREKKRPKKNRGQKFNVAELTGCGGTSKYISYHRISLLLEQQNKLLRTFCLFLFFLPVSNPS